MGDQEVWDGDHLQVLHWVVSRVVGKVWPGVDEELGGGELRGRAAGAGRHRLVRHSQRLQARREKNRKKKHGSFCLIYIFLRNQIIDFHTF